MIVLFSALMIVYLLLYQIKWDDIVDQLSIVENNQFEESITTDSLYEDELNLDKFDEESVMLDENLDDDTNSQENTKKSDSLFDSQSWTQQTNKIMILSWTSLRYGRVESVEKLWISYQYALKDEKDIYYVFLDPQRYEFDEIVRSLGGTTYTITTEKEIIENKLFWDKVTFINLPEYNKNKVVMLVEIDNLLRLLQVNYSIYHNSKWYIKQLFIN
jgi:hypothetical protein